MVSLDWHSPTSSRLHDGRLLVQHHHHAKAFFIQFLYRSVHHYALLQSPPGPSGSDKRLRATVVDYKWRVDQTERRYRRVERGPARVWRPENVVAVHHVWNVWQDAVGRASTPSDSAAVSPKATASPATVLVEHALKLEVAAHGAAQSRRQEPRRWAGRRGHRLGVQAVRVARPVRLGPFVTRVRDERSGMVQKRLVAGPQNRVESDHAGPRDHIAVAVPEDAGTADTSHQAPSDAWIALPTDPALTRLRRLDHPVSH